MASDPNQNIQKNQVEARQGTTRPMVVYVLIASVVLIVLAFLGVWLFSK